MSDDIQEVSVPRAAPEEGGVSRVRKMMAAPWLVWGGVTSAVFCTLTLFGPILPLYLDGIGLNKTQIGVALFMLPATGLLAVFISRHVARLGAKRVCISFYAARKFILLLLLLAPWAAARFDNRTVFVFTAAIFLVFGLARATAETAIYPWTQEIIPDEVRGKLGAVIGIVASVAAIASLLGGNFLIKIMPGMGGLTLVMAVGIAFGFFHVATLLPLPGGKPRSASENTGDLDILAPLRDGNFRAFIGSVCVVMIGLGYGSFVPLFYTQTMRLSAGDVLLISVWANAGVLATSFVWGWCADRFGSKPVMATGLLLFACNAVVWIMVVPASSGMALVPASVLAFTGAGFFQAYNVGMARYLFVSAVPAGKRYSYMAVYYAVTSLFGAIGPLAAGRVLDLLGAWRFSAGPIRLEPISLLVGCGALCLLICLRIVAGLTDREAVPTGEFIGMFFEGNPFLAFHSIFRFRFAWREKMRIFQTERMGQAKTRINAGEIIEAMYDLSFSVRYEAVVSAARMPSDRKITAALMRIVLDKEPDLSIAACWALGRIGDARAIPALRAAFKSEFALLRARAARSLGTLGDSETLPAIRGAFRTEDSDGLRVAYASALGVFRDCESLREILALLRRLDRRVMREETAFAAARIAGGEEGYTKLWRSARKDFFMALAQAFRALRGRAARLPATRRTLRASLTECMRAAEASDLRGVAALLVKCLREAPAPAGGDGAAALLAMECASALEEAGDSRQEYIILGMHAIELLLEPDEEGK